MMSPNKILALLTLLTTLTISDFPLIQNPNAKIQNSQVLAQTSSDRKAEANRLLQQGREQFRTSQFEAALQSWQQSLIIYREIKDRLGEGESLGNLGSAYRSLGDYTKAIEYLQQSLSIAWEIKDRNGEGASLGNLGSAYHSLGDYTKAIEYYQQSLAIRREIKDRLGEGTVLGNLGSAYHSLGIYDGFKINGKEETHKSELYIWVIKPTGEVTFRRSDLKSLWQQQNTSLAKLITNSRKSIGVRNRSELASIVVELSPQAQQRQLAQQRQKLQQLHQLLIEPIANPLPADPQARVIFIPQEELFLVPFPALVDASGQYLIEKHTLLSAPSIQLLDLTRQQRQRLGNPKRQAGIGNQLSNLELLIVGNPLMPNVWNPQTGRKEQLSYLKGAEKEAEALSNLFGVPALLNEQATEQAIKQQISNARIVHLATHGLLDYGTPEDTGVLDFPGAVALASGDGEDGLLTSAEIVDMNLKAELVVLSACDTGRGRIRSEGVIGLSRSLISAGVPSVIVSLWAVDDAATTELMQEFYQQWQQNPDKAQALRQAMLTTKQKHPDPRLWAAFTLIGEAE